ncbi:NADH dehydrogenase (ubiquinone) B18 subunit [Amblyomma americanum]
MGQWYGRMTVQNDTAWMTVMEPEKKVFQPEYDPMMGFPNGRKPREMVATAVEMESAKIPPELRNFCAHKLIEMRACMKAKFPFVTACGHARHEYAACMHEDYMIRYKEYERARRLKEREERLAKKAKPLLLE